MTTFTIIEYTPSHARYDGCDRSYYGYEESELSINHYDDYEDALAAADRTNSSEIEVTVLINGVPVDDILDYSEDKGLREQATGLKSLL